MRVLLTGGCGFIGSAVIRHMIRETAHEIINIDKMTYAASEDALESALSDQRHTLVRADIADLPAMRAAFATYQPDAVMHLAAETHVDRSIDGPGPFIHSNVVGTYTLLDAAREYWMGMAPERKAAFRFHHVSTDEVFGALGPNDPPFTETTPYDPRSPYSASKAASDHLVRAWHHTYGLPTIVSNTANNYGPWQFPEKLIPLVTLNALEGRELPVYGDGSNKRDWLFVDDHAVALTRVLEIGKIGKTYAISARQPRSNLEVVHAICAALDARLPDPAGPRTRSSASSPTVPAMISATRSTRAAPRRRWTGRRRMISRRAWPAPSTGTWPTASGGRPCAAAAIVVSGSALPRMPRHEGHPARRRLRHPPASDDAGHQQAAAAGL